jgi:hypothetical protein
MIAVWVTGCRVQKQWQKWQSASDWFNAKFGNVSIYSQRLKTSKVTNVTQPEYWNLSGQGAIPSGS